MRDRSRIPASAIARRLRGQVGGDGLRHARKLPPQASATRGQAHSSACREVRNLKVASPPGADFRPGHQKHAQIGPPSVDTVDKRYRRLKLTYEL
jgi:hypothetical protein